MDSVTAVIHGHHVLPEDVRKDVGFVGFIGFKVVSQQAAAVKPDAPQKATNNPKLKKKS